MKTFKLLSLAGALVLGATLTVGACAAAAPPAAAAPVVAPAGAPSGATVDAYLVVYEALRGDDLAKAQAAAPALERAAAAQPDLAKAARALATTPDIATARVAFGDASKALITLLAANPAAARGLYAFRCPMAKGYQKWVQRSEKLANPYMGASMPHCGSGVAMEP